MKRSLLMFAAAASFLVPAAAPLAVLAQDQPQAQEDGPRRGDRRGQSQRERGDMAGSPRQRQAEPRMERRPEARAEQGQRPQRPDWTRPDRSDGQRPDGPGRPEQAERPNRPDRPARPPEAARPDRPSRPDQSRPDRPDWNRPARPDGVRPDGGRPGAGRPDRPDWNRPDRPGAQRPDQRPGRPDRPDRPSQWNRDRDYRDFHNRWNRDQWRRDWNQRHRNDWWRNDRRFRGWTGVRLGFYFAPGYGYYSVPRSYWNRQWYVGQYLPDIFWRYQVNDWRTYGLGYPPPGTRWVYVDNSIYLIDDYDGYIIEVIRDAWRW